MSVRRTGRTVQDVTNNSVFEYYLNSWTEQQYWYSVFGFSQYRIVFGIWVFWHTEQYLVFGFFGTPYQYSGIRIVGLNTCPNSFTYFQNKMSCRNKNLNFSFVFSKMLYTIRYSNSETEQYYSYSVLGFSSYQIVFGIWYSDFLNTEQYSIFGIR